MICSNWVAKWLQGVLVAVQRLIPAKRQTRTSDLARAGLADLAYTTTAVLGAFEACLGGSALFETLPDAAVHCAHRPTVNWHNVSASLLPFTVRLQTGQCLWAVCFASAGWIAATKYLLQILLVLLLSSWKLSFQRAAECKADMPSSQCSAASPATRTVGPGCSSAHDAASGFITVDTRPGFRQIISYRYHAYSWLSRMAASQQLAACSKTSIECSANLKQSLF